MARDITARKWKEKAVTDALGRFESIIEHTPMVAVQGFDINGCIYHWNPVSEKLYGMGLKDVLEKPFHELFLEKKEARRFLADLKKVFEEGLPVETREFAIITAGGEKSGFTPACSRIRGWALPGGYPHGDGYYREKSRGEAGVSQHARSLTGLYNRVILKRSHAGLATHFRPVSIIVAMWMI